MTPKIGGSGPRSCEEVRTRGSTVRRGVPDPCAGRGDVVVLTPAPNPPPSGGTGLGRVEDGCRPHSVCGHPGRPTTPSRTDGGRIVGDPVSTPVVEVGEVTQDPVTHGPSCLPPGLFFTLHSTRHECLRPSRVRGGCTGPTSESCTRRVFGQRDTWGFWGVGSS